jgi:hypothetical protein
MKGTLFIELEYPRELIVCIRIGAHDSYDPYLLYTVEFGRDIIDDMQASNEFEKIDSQERANLFKDGRTYEYDRIKDRIAQGFLQILTT